MHILQTVQCLKCHFLSALKKKHTWEVDILWETNMHEITELQGKTQAALLNSRASGGVIWGHRVIAIR